MEIKTIKSLPSGWKAERKSKTTVHYLGWFVPKKDIKYAKEEAKYLGERYSKAKTYDFFKRLWTVKVFGRLGIIEMTDGITHDNKIVRFKTPEEANKKALQLMRSISRRKTLVALK